MAKLSREAFENFFAYYKGEPHQKAAIALLYDRLDDQVLSESADWVQQYRTPQESTTPTAYFSMSLRKSSGLVRGMFEVRRGKERLLSVVATSGIPPYQGPNDWGIKGAGPIPPFKGISINLRPIFLPQTGIEGNFYPIIPFMFANGRGDFGVHKDANVPGTAGCVGIIGDSDWKKTEDCFKRLRAEGFDSIALTVDYSGDSQGQAPKPPLSSLDQALRDAKTTGASARTASQDGLKMSGVAASRQMARTDLNRVREFLPVIKAAANAYDLPVALVAAIASRESRVGNVLDREGYGDFGNGYGHMQVDKRYHQIKTEDGPGSLTHYRQACGIYANYLDQVARRYPSWSMSDRIRGALVAYNSGMSNVQSVERADVGTTGGDYSADVIARAQYFQTAL